MCDPYAVLGVGRRASAAEIKAAYRALAKRWHPDRHRGDTVARQRFIEISDAYQQLGGQQAAGKSAAPRPRRKTAGDGAASTATESRPAADPAEDAEMMERIFGVAPARTRIDDAPGIDSIPDADNADEEPAEPGKKKGGVSHGRAVLQALNALFSRRPRSAENENADAPGEPAIIEVTVPLAVILSVGAVESPPPDGSQRSVEIAPGAADGSRVALSGKGASEAIVRHEASDELWSAGSDVHAVLAVDLDVAVLGGRKEFTTLDGAIRLAIPAWSGSDRTLRVAGRGLPKPEGTRGDLYVHLRVMLPETPDERITDLFKARKEGFHV